MRNWINIMELHSDEKSWHITVYDGDDSHNLIVNAPDEEKAKHQAIDTAEETWGSSAWRIWEINGKRIIMRDENPEVLIRMGELEAGQEYEIRKGIEW